MCRILSKLYEVSDIADIQVSDPTVSISYIEGGIHVVGLHRYAYSIQASLILYIAIIR